MDGVELVVSHVDLASSPTPSTQPLPTDQHYVAFDVSFVDTEGDRVIDSSNLDPLSGVPLVAPSSPSSGQLASDGSTGAAGIGLADEGGPVSGRTSQGSTGFDWHDAVGLGTQCNQLSGSGVGSVVVENGPTQTLMKGGLYGQVRLCFAVAGAVDQPLTVVWVPAPLAEGLPQPPAQYLALQR